MQSFLTPLLAAAVMMVPLARDARAPVVATSKASNPTVPLAKMVGQQVMGKMDGTSPDPGLLERIREGHVGGVILYADNIVSPGQTRALIHRLQQAAKAGHNPPLLISTDQEGGQVKRLPWAPPTVDQEQMGADGARVSRQQGGATGRALRKVGINVDLAPVVDVAHSSSSFIWQQGRSFGMTSSRVIHSAVPFALGMLGAHVVPTAKHFPGLGGARTDTDYARVKLRVGPRDLAPYKVLIKDHAPMVMVSVGVYPKLDPSNAPAALSRPIVTGLLRKKLGFTGTTISDDLQTATGYSTEQAVVRADRAGIDIILVATDESAASVAYRSIIAAARKGRISRATIEAAYAQILALKRRYA